jgi:hypothetical protein
LLQRDVGGGSKGALAAAFFLTAGAALVYYARVSLYYLYIRSLNLP